MHRQRKSGMFKDKVEGIILAKQGLVFNCGHQLVSREILLGPFFIVRPRAEALYILMAYSPLPQSIS